ncbi:MAG TPA: hypothetical protein DCG57_09490 [Candidatus Riflebacteria bacterium]|nr:hypothetical protein [Candidatus Riflebacteria bacterium]
MLSNESGLLKTATSGGWSVLFMLFAISLTLALPAQASNLPESWKQSIAEAEKHGAEQLLLVFTSAAGNSKAELFCLERRADGWESAIPAMGASVGRKGIAESGTKREGDGRTPYGIFPIGMAFGYQATHTTKMPYRQMHKEDIWVDDPSAADYNRLVRKDSTSAKSFEYMRRKDDLYKLGLVVEYNTNPVVPGMGSAIFIHIWGRPFGSTAGCLGLPEPDIEKVLGFLDPAKNPVIGFFRSDLH